MPNACFPQTGQCRCGATRFEVTEAPVLTAACHCRGCQRMSSSAYSLTAMFPAGAFRVIAGSPVRGGQMSEVLSHYCCPGCMNWMFTRISYLDNLVHVRPVLFDDPSWFRPYIETMTAEKLPWVQVPAEHSYKGFPDMEEFGQLLERFATWVPEAGQAAIS